MKFFFDTEFIEDGRTIDLISIGVVSEDGREYYAESAECDLSKADSWVTSNVLPHLTGIKKSRKVIAKELRVFMGVTPEIWAYYADYDWVVLCQLYGAMVNLPLGWPMFCRDVMQLCADLGGPRLPKNYTVEHHALADARWVRKTWLYLQGLK